MASNFYRQADRPKYLLGHGLELGFVGAGLVAVVMLRLNYQRINKKRAQLMESADIKEIDLASMGDRAPTFRYIL